MKKEVKMKFNDRTVRKVEELAKIKGHKNKTQIVAEAISFYHEVITKKKNEGVDFYSIWPDGKKKKLLVIDALGEFI